MAASTSNRARVAGVSFLLFCASLLLISYSKKNPSVTRFGSGLIAQIFSPIQLISHGAIRGVTQFWDNYLNLINVRQELLVSRERLATLEAQNSSLLELENENKRLRELLKISAEGELHGVVAEVIGYDPSNWVKSVSLNRGSLDGVSIGQAVLQGNGLVGQVIAVGRSVSKVLLIIDHGSGVDAIVQSSRARGVVSGAADNRCEMRYVVREDEVKVGDRIISSGLDGVFPKGLLIGVVAESERKENGLFSSISIKPAVDFNRLESVLIVTQPAPDKNEEKVPVKKIANEKASK